MSMTVNTSGERPSALLAAIRAAAQESDVDRLAVLLLPRPGGIAESPLEALAQGNLRSAWRRCDRWGAADRIRWLLIVCVVLEGKGSPEEAFATLRRLDQSEWPSHEPLGRATAAIMAEAATTSADRIARLARTLAPEPRLLVAEELTRRNHFDAAARCALDFDGEKRQRLLPITAKALADSRTWDDAFKACERMPPVARARTMARVARMVRSQDAGMAERAIKDIENALDQAREAGDCPALARLALTQLLHELGQDERIPDHAQQAIHEAVQSERFPGDCLRAARRLQRATWAPDRVKVLARLADFLRLAGAPGVAPLHVLLMLAEVGHEQENPHLVDAALGHALDRARLAARTEDMRARREAIVFLGRAALSLATVGRREEARQTMRRVRHLLHTLPPGIHVALAWRAMGRQAARAGFSRLAQRFMERACRVAPPGRLLARLHQDLACSRVRTRPERARRLAHVLLATGQEERLRVLLERLATHDRLDRVLGPVASELSRPLALHAMDCEPHGRYTPDEFARLLGEALMKEPPTQQAIRAALADVAPFCATNSHAPWSRYIQARTGGKLALEADSSVLEARRRLEGGDHDGFARYLSMASENPVRAIRLFGLLATLAPERASRVAQLLLRRLA